MVSDKIQELLDDTLKYFPPFIETLKRTKQLSADEMQEFFTELQNNHPELIEKINEYGNIPRPVFPVIMNPGFTPISEIPPETIDEMARKTREILGENPVHSIVEELKKDPRFHDIDPRKNPETMMRLMMPKLLQKTVGNEELLNLFVETMVQSEHVQGGLKAMKKLSDKEDLIDSLGPIPPSPPTTTTTSAVGPEGELLSPNEKEGEESISKIGAKTYLDEEKVRKENKPNWGKKHLIGFDYSSKEEEEVKEES
jgi:hypothetical protein